MRAECPSTGKEVSVLTVDDAGAIVHCEGNVERMFGYTPESLLDQDVGSLIPRLREIGITKRGAVNGTLRYLCQLGVPFQIRHREAESYDSRLIVVDLSSDSQFRLRVFVWRDA